MNEDKPKRTKRRINRKRQALKAARKQNSNTRVWSVCVNTEKDLWRSFVLDCDTKSILCSGKQVHGKNNSYKSLNEVIDKVFDTK